VNAIVEEIEAVEESAIEETATTCDEIADEKE
jgi:hypothetical protein